MSFLNALATPPLTPYRYLLSQTRAWLRRLIDAVGARRMLYVLGLVRNPPTAATRQTGGRESYSKFTAARSLRDLLAIICSRRWQLTHSIRKVFDLPNSRLIVK